MTARPSSPEPIEILLVEDSPSDVLLVREAFAYHKVMNTLHVVGDGVAAMAFVRGEEPFSGHAQPGLILLDLNLPKKSGREVLEELKADPDLKSIPVVVLTTSKAEEDVLRSYSLHANCYVTKPVDFDKFTDVVRNIRDYWFTVVTLPGGNP